MTTINHHINYQGKVYKAGQEVEPSDANYSGLVAAGAIDEPAKGTKRKAGKAEPTPQGQDEVQAQD